MNKKQQLILWFKDIRKKDGQLVGGKNASLGEMFSRLQPQGINIPNGFALTSRAYWYFLGENKLDKKLENLFKEFDPNNIQSLKKTGKAAREFIKDGKFPDDFKKEIIEAYEKLTTGSSNPVIPRLDRGIYSKEDAIDSRFHGNDNSGQHDKQGSVAVRSSATAEDLADASFAGQHETFLNIKTEKELLVSIKKCMASLFTDRAIAYREEKGFDHLKIALSVGVQKMVRSDLASSGVMFTLDTETGLDKVVLINSIWGVGEYIVKGKITPDQFYVFKETLLDQNDNGYRPIIRKDLGRKTHKLVYNNKGGLKEVKVDPGNQQKFSLTDEEVLKLSKWACAIEDLYGCPQDIEWAKDGQTGELFIVQSRPETVHASQEQKTYKEYKIETTKKPLLEGIAIGDKIGQGKIRVIEDVKDIDQFKEGEVLVTEMTDPDWVPIMRLASAIVTDKGGKTAHAAIVSRELGVPCIVGTQKGTKVLKDGQQVTVDCTQGLHGRVFEGRIDFETNEIELEELPDLPVKIMVNIGAPDTAFKASFLPVDGVGLARQEFIIAEKIRVHPLALYHYDRIKNKEFKVKNDKKANKVIKKIDKITVEHKGKQEFFVKELAEGIGQIAAAFYPRPVIVRLSDFKSNEYKNLIGGQFFESEEANPMMGFRGASRYLDKDWQPAFKMECQAIKRVRQVFGFKNIALMVPFCRTAKEGARVVALMEEFGLKKGEDDLKIYVMCEVPSNVILAKDFLEIFDGFSIGSNDLTQLALGLDRDNAKISQISDERDPVIKKMVHKAITVCRENNKYSGICGEAPSTYPEFAKFLIDEGIESISLNTNSVIKTILQLKDS